jgi:hypothetical protein
MVAGDICEPPPDQGGGVALPEAGPFPGKSKGFVAPCPKPVDCGDDGFDDVNDCSTSSAVDTAPRAISMAKPRQMPHGAAFYFPGRSISKRRAMAKKPTKPWILHIWDGSVTSAIDAAAAEISARNVPRMLRSAPPLRRGALLIRGPFLI